jgi:hypothetical protein
MHTTLVLFLPHQMLPSPSSLFLSPQLTNTITNTITITNLPSSQTHTQSQSQSSLPALPTVLKVVMTLELADVRMGLRQQ